MPDLLTINEASEWASNYLKKQISASNISYLIQYGRINKISDNGVTRISKKELINYYENSYNGRRQVDWTKELGEDLNWHLSFDYLKESQTTKHVHRLHPYKGKFIPQLVEYFLNDKTDDFKKEIYFQKGDVILDPFCGSGTTLVQANEMGMHAVGIDISAFNALISNVKTQKVNFIELKKQLDIITEKLKNFSYKKNHINFENALLKELYKFNNQYFPSPLFKQKVSKGEINEKKYGLEKEKEFLNIFNNTVKGYEIEVKQDNQKENFIDAWYLKPVREEIDLVFELIKKIQDKQTKKIISIIFSRTIRSCRATTHADLATLKEPVTSTYYCRKHKKICKPLFSILSWWERYSEDTINRLKNFSKLRSNTYQVCIKGDSRNINLLEELKSKHDKLASLVSHQKIKGIFSSPPYVGLIDYHEQHAYAYDLFGFERNDQHEIGPLFKGKGKEARESYMNGISEVLINSKRYLINDYDIFLVANDKFNMYPKIADNAGMRIVSKYKRPVLNRTEKDKGAYSEIIFHLKEK